MFERKTLQNLQAYFDPLSARGGPFVYCYRFSAYQEQMDAFLQRYEQQARQRGIVIEGRIPNPDEKNLAYYEEIMGTAFQMDPAFISAGLKKWLPRLGEAQRNNVAAALYDSLDALRREGKNENILKNAYIKFMCWLYYKFERILQQLGQDDLPKILYDGSASAYELRLLTLLARSGCDVVLLQTEGEAAYQKADPGSSFSLPYPCDGATVFPEDYGVALIRRREQQQARQQTLFGAPPKRQACTNAWITGAGLEDVQKIPQTRGEDTQLFYNCLLRLRGAADKLTYAGDLYRFSLTLKEAKRKTVIIEGQIPVPSPEEIAAIRRKHYTGFEQMLLDLSGNIQFTSQPELQSLMVRAFVTVMTQQAAHHGVQLNKQMNQAVYLLAWLRRYQSALFSGWRASDIACLIHLGGCRTEYEALFLRLLADLPVDVLILCPDLADECCLQDARLFEKRFDESLCLTRFPTGEGEMRVGTVAFHAERELDTVLYQDSGLYRNQQYQQAVSVALQTTYEEIAILWDQELKYRPNFGVVANTVTLPTIFAKVSGVKDSQTASYWSGIKTLETEDTMIVKNPPCCRWDEPNPQKAFATEFLKNGRLQKEKIKSHRAYPYAFLREEIQAHILDKLQLLLEQRLIKGTFENGMEYTIVATVLNLPKELLRLLQQFDFTKKNPKLIYINTLEQAMPAEDAILTAFLHLTGFDVLFFVPTGYQTVEFHFTKKIMQEHQIGAYLYDVPIPDFRTVSGAARASWRERLFGKG